MRVFIILKPTNERGTKSEYTQFRNFLKKDGYMPFIPEVYERVCTNRKSAEKHLRRTKKNLPKTGAVYMFRMTEIQFKNINILVGDHSNQEKIVGNSMHIML